AANINAPFGDAAAGDAGLDTISFNIAGAPGTVHTIALGSALPNITEPLFIDGYSQLGASPNTLADGDNAFFSPSSSTAPTHYSMPASPSSPAAPRCTASSSRGSGTMGSCSSAAEATPSAATSSAPTRPASSTPGTASPASHC